MALSRYMGEFKESPRPKCFAAADIIHLIESGHRDVADEMIKWSNTPAYSLVEDGEITPGSAEVSGWLRHEYGCKSRPRSWHRHRAAFAGLNDVCACTPEKMELWIAAAEKRIAERGAGTGDAV